MGLLEWLRQNVPGTEASLADELRITHERGGTSSLWYRSGESGLPPDMASLKDFYGGFDGADLFSSTFKIASLAQPRGRGGVEITPSVASLQKVVREDGVCFPEPCVPFMLQAGIGVYGVTRLGRIYEWDLELKDISGEYDDVCAILDEWFGVVSEPA